MGNTLPKNQHRATKVLRHEDGYTFPYPQCARNPGIHINQGQYTNNLSKKLDIKYGNIL